MIDAPFFAKFVIVFVAVFLGDIFYIKWMTAAHKKQPHTSASWAAGIIAVGGLSIVSYTSDHWLLLAAILGAYVGTWWAVRREVDKSSEAL